MVGHNKGLTKIVSLFERTEEIDLVVTLPWTLWNQKKDSEITRTQLIKHQLWFFVNFKKEYF